MVRSLMEVFPTDHVARNIDRQFMWGDALLVTPVLEQARHVTVSTCVVAQRRKAPFLFCIVGSRHKYITRPIFRFFDVVVIDSGCEVCGRLLPGRRLVRPGNGKHKMT